MLLIDSRVWLLWLFCCLPWGGIRAEEFAVIKGKIEGKIPVKEVRLMTVENGVPVKYAGTTIAGNGSFAFMFQPAETGFYYLYDGNNYHRMYIKAGDEIQLQRIDGVWKQIGCVGEENRLLAHWTEMERPLKTRSKAEAYGAYFPRFDSVRQEVDRWLEKIIVRDSLFRKQLKETVEFDLLYDFVSYIAKNQQFYESEERQSAYYRQIIGHFPLEDERILQQPYGIQLLRKYFAYKRSFVVRQGEYSLDEWLAEIGSPVLKAEFVLAEIDYASIRDVLIPYYKKENGLRILSFPILPGNIVLWPISGGNISLSIFGRPGVPPVKPKFLIYKSWRLNFRGKRLNLSVSP